MTDHANDREPNGWKARRIQAALDAGQFAPRTMAAQPAALTAAEAVQECIRMVERRPGNPRGIGLAIVDMLDCLAKLKSETTAAPVAQADALDAARLDWLETNSRPNQFLRLYAEGPKKWFDSATVGSDYAPTLRQAIDAAILSTKGQS